MCWEEKILIISVDHLRYKFNREIKCLVCLQQFLSTVSWNNHMNVGDCLFMNAKCYITLNQPWQYNVIAFHISSSNVSANMFEDIN